LQKLVIVPSKKDLGLAFKGSQKMVLEALEVTDLVLVFLYVAASFLMSPLPDWLLYLLVTGYE
jgi:hypothetical protein